MARGSGAWTASPILTVGETVFGTTGALNMSSQGSYTATGVLDGLGAYALDRQTVRVFANHELLNNRGYAYELSDGQGGTFTLKGSRISYFDIDRRDRKIVDAGIAYDTIVDQNGDLAIDASFLAEPFVTAFGGQPGDGVQLEGLSRFCSSHLIEAHQFGRRRGLGLEETIYFTGEEDGSGFNSVGGAEWALDIESGALHAVPSFGRGSWENVTEVDTGSRHFVAFVLADDTSPFDADDYAAEADPADADAEAAPLYLYVGRKDPSGGFLGRNGLAHGKLFVWVSDSGARTPAEFNGTSGPRRLQGRWTEIDNTPRPSLSSQDGSTGYDEYGYPTQRTLWKRAEAAGAFGFSRPEDVATNPRRGDEAVLASTGVATYAGGADTFGTIYTVRTRFRDLEWLWTHGGTILADLAIAYDGDADPSRALRSPDNVDWADDGHVYVQEDKAVDESLTGEPLFGPGAANPNEAGIVRLHPRNGHIERIANIDRSVVLDASIAFPEQAVDVDAGTAGEWETSGILDVSSLFSEKPGTLFLFDVQAHGIADQDGANPGSRINDDDLVEGGQLLMLKRERRGGGGQHHRDTRP